MRYIPDHGHFLIAEDDTYIGEVHTTYFCWEDHVSREWCVDSAFEPISRSFPTRDEAAAAVHDAWEHRYEGCSG